MINSNWFVFPPSCRAPGDEDDDEEGEKKKKKDTKVGDCSAPESFEGCFQVDKDEDNDWVSDYTKGSLLISVNINDTCRYNV